MRIWVTRSQPGAELQGEALSRQGFEVVVAPVLDIEPTGRNEPSGIYPYVVFLSEQAVRHGGSLDYCRGAEVFAVGAATARALAQRQVYARTPAHASTEGLLEAFADVKLAGRSVLIVAGECGRKTLRDTLSQRGATITEHLCYRRVNRTIEPADLEGVEAILVGSQDGFRQVARLWFDAGGRADVLMIVASERIAGLAPELGFRNVQIAQGAAAEDWIAALDHWRPPE